MILIDHYFMLKNVLKKLFYSGCVSIFVATFLFSKSYPPTLPFFGLAAGAGYSLVLVDEEDRRYFKQQEVVFWRKNENLKSTISSLSSNNLETQNNVIPVSEDV